MTTGNISELSSMIQATASQLLQTNASKSSDASFSMMMNQAGSSNEQSRQMQDNAGVNSSKQTEKYSDNGGSARSVNETGKAREKLEKTAKATKDPDQSEIDEKVTQAGEKVIDTIKEELSVEDEDVQNAMEALSMSMADLLDPVKLQQLFTELSPAEDSMALLTDEGLYSQFTQLTEMVEIITDEIKEELGITDEQFQIALEQLKAGEEAASETERFDTEAIQDMGTVSNEELKDTETVETANTTDKADSKEKLSANDEDVKAEVEHRVSSRRERVSERKEAGQNNTSGDGSLSNTDPGINQNIEQVDTVSDADIVSYSGMRQTNEIARQIVSQIQMRVTQETTSLEMELNPASLGRVALTIEAKNGVVTAAFAAQNEAVKAAIEGQIQLLQENLEKQGVKVEAVEVTIASHEFEQNLNKGNEQNQQRDEAQKTQAVAGRRHRINLSLEEDGDEEEMTEEETIARDMMIKNGNTVDFMA